MHSGNAAHVRITLTAKQVYLALCVWMAGLAVASTVKSVTADASAAMGVVAVIVTLQGLNPNVPMAKPVLQGGVNNATYANHWCTGLCMLGLFPC